MAFSQQVIKFLEVANQAELTNDPKQLRKMVQQSVVLFFTMSIFAQHEKMVFQRDSFMFCPYVC